MHLLPRWCVARAGRLSGAVSPAVSLECLLGDRDRAEDAGVGPHRQRLHDILRQELAGDRRGGPQAIELAPDRAMNVSPACETPPPSTTRSTS